MKVYEKSVRDYLTAVLVSENQNGSDSTDWCGAGSQDDRTLYCMYVRVPSSICVDGTLETVVRYGRTFLIGLASKPGAS